MECREFGGFYSRFRIFSSFLASVKSTLYIKIFSETKPCHRLVGGFPKLSIGWLF